jgi:cyclic pyranopterin phosphate synthase
MPPEGIPLLPRSELLTYEEIYRVVQIAAGLGITRVRLSGGEPLVRSRLVRLIQLLSEIEGIEDISLSTNGVLLEHYAAELKQAGLHRVNVSLDTLKRHRFRDITGYDRLGEVLRGIEAAYAVGLEPVKINMVVMRGINEDEVIEFAYLSGGEGWHVRFIELMPFGVNPLGFVSAQEIYQHLAPLGSLEPCLPPVGNGPARYYRLSRAQGTIGFITPISEPFCFRCNRLRLTADGQLLPCLLSKEGIDLRALLRGEASPQELRGMIEKAAASKPRGHRLEQGDFSQRQMAQIGG